VWNRRRSSRSPARARSFDEQAPAGPVAGHITIRQGEKVILDRPLADKVQDNYKGWSTNERCPTWMTRPEYKNVIGAKEVEEFRTRVMFPIPRA
jgi:hypothetical protein